MAQPPTYSRQEDFEDHQTNNPGQPMNGANLDSEFNAVKTTLDAILANMALLQRDDTALKNAVVHPDALTTATLALLSDGSWTPKGAWVTATAYAVGDIVEEGATSYVCAEAHTSGTFSTDHTVGKWVVLGYSQSVVQSGSSVFAAAGGTADVMTAAFTPSVESLTDGQELRVRALGANTVAGVTLSVDGIAAKTIKRLGNLGLSIGDIPRADYEMHLRYNGTNDVFELLNPAREGVDGVANLRLMSPVNGLRVRLNYHTSDGDGGHGWFRGVTGAAAGTYTDDNGITIVPTGGDGSAAFVRQIDGYVSPEMFGAQGDWSGAAGTDDTTATQAAIDSGLPVVGDKTKTYLITSLTKTGASAVYMADLDLQIDNSATSHGLYVTNATGGEIRNVSTTMDYTAVAGTDMSGLRLDACSKVRIIGGRFEGSRATAYGVGTYNGPLYVYNSTEITVDGVEMLGGELENFYFDTCYNSRIINSYSHDPVANSCIGTVRGSHNVVANCVAENSVTSAISVNGIHNVVDGCVVRGTSAALSAGINVGHPAPSNADYSVVTGCTVIDAVEAGIAVTGCGNVAITGNTIRTDTVATNYGILGANDPGSMTITGNVLIGAFSVPIRYNNATSSRPSVTITGNTNDSSLSSTISVIGAGELVISGNNLKNPSLGAATAFTAFVSLASCEKALIAGNMFVNDQGGGFGPESIVRAPGSTDVVNIDIKDNFARGWVTQFIDLHSSQYRRVRDNDISDDPVYSGVSASAGTTETTVTNSNVLSGYSFPIMSGSTAAAAALTPFIKSVSDGQFVIGHGSAAGGEFFRYSIQ